MTLPTQDRPACSLRVLYTGSTTADMGFVTQRLNLAGFAAEADFVRTPNEFAAQLRTGLYNLVVADYELAGGSGIEALLIWQRELKNIPLVLLASPENEKRVIEWVKLGATDYVLKNNLERLPLAVWKASLQLALRELQERSKEAVAASEERLTLLLNSTAEAIYGLDMEGRCTFSNPACLRLLRYSSPSDLLGKDLHALCHHTRPDGRPYPREECLIYRAFRRGQQVHVDDEVLWRADGTSFPVEYWAYPLLRGGEVVGAVMTFFDITERQRGEQADGDSEARFRLLFSKNPLPMWLHDLRTLEIVEVNEAAASHYGYSRQEFLGMRISDICPPEDLSKLAHAMETILLSPGCRGERKHRVKDGRTIDVDVTRYPLELGGRTVAVVVAQDITERKQTAELLAERELLLRMVIGNVPVALFALNGEGRITLLEGGNPALLGLMPGRLVGSSVFDEYAHLPSILEKVRKTLAGDPTEFVGDVGGIVVHAQAVPVRDDEGAVVGLAGVALDITKHKRAEEDLMRAKQAVEAARRATNEFLVNMRHELHTPIAWIIGMTQLTLETELTLEQRDYLGFVKTSADELLDTIDNILGIFQSRGERTLKKFDLRNDLGETAKLLAAAAHRKGLELFLNIRADTPQFVRGDAVRLRQIIRYLIDNAVKFTERGEISLHVETERQEGEGVLVHFTVADTGIGIPREKQQVIFESFSRADGSVTPKFGGTGLGLTLSARLVEKMGGRIWVESESGCGSRFHFTAYFERA